MFFFKKHNHPKKMSQIDLNSLTDKIKKPTMTLPICKGVTKSGKPCSYRGRHNGYCKIHAAPGTLCDTGKKMGDCPICYEEVTKGTSTTTRCKHVFHKACLERWMEEKTTCPMCRENIRPTTGQLQPRVRMHETFIGEIVLINSPEELDTFLDSVRNAPIEIRFTNNYWETS